MSKDLVPTNPEPAPTGQMLIYSDGGLQLQVRLDGKTVWLSQIGMAELFQTTKQNISLHIQNIFEEGELAPEATVKQRESPTGFVRANPAISNFPKIAIVTKQLQVLRESIFDGSGPCPDAALRLFVPLLLSIVVYMV